MTQGREAATRTRRPDEPALDLEAVCIELIRKQLLALEIPHAIIATWRELGAALAMRLAFALVAQDSSQAAVMRVATFAAKHLLVVSQRRGRIPTKHGRMAGSAWPDGR